MSTENEGLPWNDEPNEQPQIELAESSITSYATRLSHTGSMPIVIFFGPKGVGKTVTVLRLLDYLRQSKHTFPVSTATPKGGQFKASSQAFQVAMNKMTDSIPPRTKAVDFLMLDVRCNSELQWHLLEAPGEHFFNEQDVYSDQYPRYMEQIFTSNQKKVYVVFISQNMFDNRDHRKAYSKRLAKFINSKVNSRRDRIIVLYNKINEDPERFRGGRIDANEIKREVFKSDDFMDFTNAINSNAKGLKHVPLIPFYSGTFYPDGQTWSPSEDTYPRALYDAIHGCIQKRSIWKWW